jgi:hypothetical protein
MPTGSEKPTALDLSAILEGLLEAGIKFILVGGLAAVVQGAPVTTMDVDIVHHRSSENISKLIAFLKSIDAIYRRADSKVIAPNEGDISGKGHFPFTTRFGPLDILAFIEQGRAYEDLLIRLALGQGLFTIFRVSQAMAIDDRDFHRRFRVRPTRAASLPCHWST